MQYLNLNDLKYGFLESKAKQIQDKIINSRTNYVLQVINSNKLLLNLYNKKKH